MKQAWFGFLRDGARNGQWGACVFCKLSLIGQWNMHVRTGGIWGGSVETHTMAQSCGAVSSGQCSCQVASLLPRPRLRRDGDGSYRLALGSPLRPSIKMLTWRITWFQSQPQLHFPRVLSISTSKCNKFEFKKEKQKPILCAENYFRDVLLSTPLIKNPLIGLGGDFAE